MKKILCTILSALALFVCASGALAADIQPRWSYVTRVSASIDISTGGTASISADGSALTMGVNKTSVTASLQQFKNSAWTEVKSWSVTEDARSASLDKGWPVAHGYSYRVVVTADAYNGSTLLESVDFTEDYGYFK